MPSFWPSAVLPRREALNICFSERKRLAHLDQRE